MAALDAIKLPKRIKVMLYVGFWMVIVGIFWQHLWKSLIPNILILRPKWELALEIQMNISAFNWLDSKLNMAKLPPSTYIEVGPYMFVKENVHDKYARDFVIRPKFEGYLRKKFFCTAKCTNLLTDTITLPNYDADLSSNSQLSLETKAIDVTSQPQILHLISLASNIDIFDREIVTLDHNRSAIDFNATGICRTVTLFADPSSENVDESLGDKFTVRTAHLLTSNDVFYAQSNYLNLSCKDSQFPLFIAPPNISVVVEPTFNYIISAVYDLQFFVLLPHGSNFQNAMKPVLKIRQKGFMSHDAKIYLKRHRFFVHLGGHICWKIFLTLGILLIICTILIVWRTGLDSKTKKDKKDQIELRLLTPKNSSV